MSLIKANAHQVGDYTLTNEGGKLVINQGTPDTVLNPVGVFGLNGLEYDGAGINDVLDGAKSLVDYVALRAYTGSADRIYITGLLVTAKPAGIAGTFQHDPTDTTGIDNKCTVIVGADGRRWKRDFDGPINVKWAGAIGGGVTSDFTAIQDAIYASPSIPVYVPAGKYVVDGKLDISQRTEFTLLGDNKQGYQGNGKEQSVFYCNGSSSYTFDLPNASFPVTICIDGVSFDGTNGITDNFSSTWPGAFRNQQSAASWFGFRLRNSSVKGSSVAGTSLINTGARFFVDIDDCEIAYATNGIGLSLTAATTYSVSKTYFHYNRQCLSVTGFSTDVLFDKCVFEASTTVASFAGVSVTFQSCHFEHIGYSIAGGYTTGVSEKGGLYPSGNPIDTWFNLVRSNVRIVGGYIFDSWSTSGLAGVFRLQPYTNPGTYQRGGYVGLFNPGMEKVYNAATKFSALFIEDPTDTDGRGNKFTIEVDAPRVTADSSYYWALLQDQQIRKIDKGQLVLHWTNGNMQRVAEIARGKLRVLSPAAQVLQTRAYSPYMVAYSAGDEIVSVGSTSIVAGYKVIKGVSTTLTGAINLSTSQTIPVASSAGISIGDRITISDPTSTAIHLGGMTVTAVPDGASITVSGTSGTASYGSMVVAHLVQEVSADGKYIGTAAPTSGTWKQGDVVMNSAPAAGGVPGWICTVPGTPGTWKSMASLAA